MSGPPSTEYRKRIIGDRKSTPEIVLKRVPTTKSEWVLRLVRSWIMG